VEVPVLAHKLSGKPQNLKPKRTAASKQGLNIKDFFKHLGQKNMASNVQYFNLKTLLVISRIIWHKWRKTS